MSKTPREWKHLERRPGSSYQQLCIKGKRIWAWTLYCEFMNEKESRTPEQLAVDWDVPLEAVQLGVHAVVWHRGVPSSLPTLGGAYNNAATAINNKGDIAGFSDLPGDGAMHAVLWKSGKRTDLGTLPGDVSSMAFGINVKDQVVGTSTDASGNSRAVLWENGAIYDLNSLIQAGSNLYLFYGGDINDAGVIAGQALDPTTGNSPAFVANPQHGATRVPMPARKFVLPQRLLDRLVRGGFGRFHFGSIHRS